MTEFRAAVHEARARAANEESRAKVVIDTRPYHEPGHTKPYPPNGAEVAKNTIMNTGEVNDCDDTSYTRRKVGRRTLLAFLVAGGAALTTYGGPKAYDMLFGVPGPSESATPEQEGADYTAKKLMGMLANGSPENKPQATLILPELIRLNPNWSVEQARTTIRDNNEARFLRRLFLEHPEGAGQELQRQQDEKDDLSAANLTAMFAAGYTPIGKRGDHGQEDRRILAHELHGGVGASVGIITTNLFRQDQRNLARALMAATYPHHAFDVHGNTGENVKGNTETAESIAQSLITEKDFGSLEMLGAALAARKPALSIRILETLVDRALKEPSHPLELVVTLSEAMAQYTESRAGVIEQLHRLEDHPDEVGDIIWATRNIAVSLAPFETQPVIDYVQKKHSRSETHLALLALSAAGRDVLNDFRGSTTAENKIWLDLALNPTDRDAADKAIGSLEKNSLMLHQSSGIISAAMVAGRRFDDAQS